MGGKPFLQFQEQVFRSLVKPGPPQHSHKEGSGRYFWGQGEVIKEGSRREQPLIWALRHEW